MLNLDLFNSKNIKYFNTGSEEKTYLCFSYKIVLYISTAQILSFEQSLSPKKNSYYQEL